MCVVKWLIRSVATEEGAQHVGREGGSYVYVRACVAVDGMTV